MMSEGRLNPHYRNGLLAGAIVALALAITTSLWFKPGLLGMPGLIAWYAVSTLCGGGAGLGGAFLVGLVPVRFRSAASILVGALFGGIGYYIELYLFLTYMFWKNPTSFQMRQSKYVGWIEGLMP